MRPFLCLFLGRTLWVLCAPCIHPLFVYFSQTYLSMLHNPPIRIRSQSQRNLLGAWQLRRVAGVSARTLLPATWRWSGSTAGCSRNHGLRPSHSNSTRSVSELIAKRGGTGTPASALVHTGTLERGRGAWLSQILVMVPIKKNLGYGQIWVVIKLGE